MMCPCFLCQWRVSLSGSQSRGAGEEKGIAEKNEEGEAENSRESRGDEKKKSLSRPSEAQSTVVFRRLFHWN